MQESEITYKNLTIRIIPQPITGDNTKVFFRILKGQDNAFILWIKTSGTSSRGLDREEVYKSLSKQGLKIVKKLIDNNEYETGSEYNETIGIQ